VESEAGGCAGEVEWEDGVVDSANEDAAVGVALRAELV